MRASLRVFTNGLPAHCALCDKPFEGPGCRGVDGRYYCTQFCAHDADTRQTTHPPAAERVMNRCVYCRGRFGLVRYRRFGKQFCSNTTHNRCKQRYIQDRADDRAGKMTINSVVSRLFGKVAIAAR